jgi:cell wall-associated NlpC family hydrolase
MGRNSLAAVTVAAIAMLSVSCASMRVAGNNERGLVVHYAREMLDKGYKYGADTPEEGFDCSGLVQFAYKKAGIKIPRTTAEQFASSERIELKKAREGDLVFFSTYAAGPTHVGIYMGGGQFIHSPSEGRRIRVDDISKNYWKKAYYGAGTFFR